MPGMYHMFPTMVNGKLQDLWRCDKCSTIFAFENNELLYCPKCKERGYPLNIDPGVEETHDPGQSNLIVKP
jgi:uncharacterized Zn ribbon protein